VSNEQGRKRRAELFDLINGYRVTQAINVAARLGVADLLKDGPQTADELAAKLSVRRLPLYRLLRALASEGLFQEVAGQRFELTPLADLLRSDVPGSLRHWAIAQGSQWMWRAWANLEYSIRTEKTAFADVYGEEFFDYCATHPAVEAEFDAGQSSTADGVAKAILDAYDFRPFSKIVDVGGGTGRLLNAVLKQNPSAEGVLMDRPTVVEKAVLDPEIRPRVQVVGGDFFESVPEGGDCYLMRRIIHDWDDERSLRILDNIKRVMRPGAKVVLVEFVLAAGNEKSIAKFIDVNLMVLFGGQERSEAEFVQLFSQAGFRLSRLNPTTAIPQVCVIEFVREDPSLLTS
jgi:SAM-dependent methyltransferase